MQGLLKVGIEIVVWRYQLYGDISCTDISCCDISCANIRCTRTDKKPAHATVSLS